KLHNVAVWIFEADGARHAWLEVLRWWSHHLQAEFIDNVGRAVDIVGIVDFERKVVETGCVAGTERQHVVIWSLGAQKHVLTVLVDRLESPAIGVELRLLAQIAGA